MAPVDLRLSVVCQVQGAVSAKHGRRGLLHLGASLCSRALRRRTGSISPKVFVVGSSFRHRQLSRTWRRRLQRAASKESEERCGPHSPRWRHDGKPPWTDNKHSLSVTGLFGSNLLRSAYRSLIHFCHTVVQTREADGRYVIRRRESRDPVGLEEWKALRQKAPFGRWYKGGQSIILQYIVQI